LVHSFARRLEEGGIVALFLQETSEARGRDTAKLEFRTLKKGWVDPAVDRDARLGRTRDDDVGLLDEEALFGQFVEEGSSV
jgi:hypothetical protein